MLPVKMSYKYMQKYIYVTIHKHIIIKYLYKYTDETMASLVWPHIGKPDRYLRHTAKVLGKPIDFYVKNRHKT